MTRFCDLVVLCVRTVLWICFAIMIATVALQVLDRNVLHLSLLWTSDMALLMFSWTIFLGAAVGLRTGVHFKVAIIPEDGSGLDRLASVVALVGGLCVAYIMTNYGWQLAMRRLNTPIQSLGIARFWLYVPLPVSGALMFLFLAETMIIGRRPPVEVSE